jgi:hypothetical protein
MKVALTPVPAGLLALDPQLICYSWITGISEVAEVVFVRKRLVEIQYLKTTITDEQRREFGDIVHDTIAQIDACHFLPHSGICFPQNPCTTCPYLGLCLNQPQLAVSRLVRRQELKALVCLTSLATQHPPMPPKMSDAVRDSEWRIVETSCSGTTGDASSAEQ